MLTILFISVYGNELSYPSPFFKYIININNADAKYIISSPDRIVMNFENRSCVLVYPLAIIFFVVPSLKSRQLNSEINITLIMLNSLDKKSVICGRTFNVLVSWDKNDNPTFRSKVNPVQT